MNEAIHTEHYEETAIQISGNLIICCNTCGTEHRIEDKNYDHDSHYVGEGPMGSRIQHDFQGEIECEECGELLRFGLTAEEYPTGALDHHSTWTDGCTVLAEPSYIAQLPDLILSALEQVMLFPSSVKDLTSDEFEDVVAEVFRRLGVETRVTPKTRDGGKDIVAEFENAGIKYTTYIECKHWTQDRPVGVGVVRELAGVINLDRKDKGVIVTSSRFTIDALREAERFGNRIQLLEFDELLGKIREIGSV